MFEPYQSASPATAPSSRAGLAPAAAQLLVCGMLVAGFLAGCASRNDGTGAPVADTPKPPVVANLVERFQVDLGEGFKVDYQVERKISKVNGKSCYAFISGNLINLSGKALSKRSVLDVAVFSQGAQLYRDITSPLADVQSGFHADFEMITSPIFPNGCPRFDRINVALRKVYL